MKEAIEMISNEIEVKRKLSAMSEKIRINLERVTKEKMYCHPSLVKAKELERQKWIAKAETMLEVLNIV